MACALLSALWQLLIKKHHDQSARCFSSHCVFTCFIIPDAVVTRHTLLIKKSVTEFFVTFEKSGFSPLLYFCQSLWWCRMSFLKLARGFTTRFSLLVSLCMWTWAEKKSNGHNFFWIAGVKETRFFRIYSGEQYVGINQFIHRKWDTNTVWRGQMFSVVPHSSVKQLLKTNDDGTLGRFIIHLSECVFAISV